MNFIYNNFKMHIVIWKWEKVGEVEGVYTGGFYFFVYII